MSIWNRWLDFGGSFAITPTVYIYLAHTVLDFSRHTNAQSWVALASTPPMHSQRCSAQKRVPDCLSFDYLSHYLCWDD